MIKTFAALVFLTVGTAASAETVSREECSKAFQGLYFSGNIGYGEGGSLKKFIDARTGRLTHKNDLAFRGVDGGMGIGYMHRLGNWTMGLAFDANWASVQGDHKHLNGRESIVAKLKNSLQLYARSGYVFCEKIMPFVGLGWDNSLWKLESAHTNAVGITNRDQKKHRQNALLWKAGIDLLAADRVVLGVEYVGTVAQRKKYFYKNEEFFDSWKPQYNKYVLTLKVIPFAGPRAASSSQSALSKDCQKAFQGVHLAGNIGYGSGAGKRAKFKDGVKNRRGLVNSRGVDGGIGTGYTHRLGSWALGLGFDANWSGAKAKRLNVLRNKSQTVRLRNSLQLYARTGYVFFEKIMPFIGMGWDNSSWKQTIKDAPLKESQTRRFNALLWKVGSDFLITRCMVVGFEYTGTIAERKKIGHSPRFIDTDTGTSGRLSNSWRPQYNKFAMTVKIVYDGLFK